jgi:lauroyl/myristoyl acyltransferase
MLGILRPASTTLPFRGALAAARFFGWLGLLMPWYGLRRLRLMRYAFGRGMGALALLSLAAERQARMLCDFVVLRRALATGPEVANWRLEQRNRGLLAEVRGSGKPFILATGHFSRQAFMSLFRTDVLPERVTTIVLPPLARGLDPRTWWLRSHYGQMLRYLKSTRQDMEFVFPGDLQAYRQLVERLREPGNVVVVFADAPWAASKGGSYARAFAGLPARSFATGTARLSRFTRAPIVVCVPYLRSDDSVVLDWTRVIQPPRERGEDADRAVTDAIVDDIERAVGQRPAQYLLDYLGERRWDARGQRWIQ